MKHRLLVLLVLACALSLVLAANAFAAVTVIELPDEAYLSSTTKVPYSIPEYGVGITEIGDEDFSVTFDSPLYQAYSYEWGATPYVEDPAAGATALWPDISTYNSAPSAMVMTLSRPVTTFGFELASIWGWPGGEGPAIDVAVTFKLSLDGDSVATINKVLSNSWATGYRDVRLFAINSDVAFDKVEIDSAYEGMEYDLTGFALNQFRYSPLVPVEVEIGGEYGDIMPDTYLYSYRPTGYFANSTADFIGRTSAGEERTVLSIPLAKLADVDVTGATLDLTKSNGTLFPLRVYRLRQTPTRGTWNEYALGSAWGAPGAKDAATDYYADVFATSSDGDFDVTALLEAAIADGDDSLDLLIVDPAPVDRRYVGFYSSDCVNAPYRPCLEVDGLAAP